MTSPHKPGSHVLRQGGSGGGIRARLRRPRGTGAAPARLAEHDAWTVDRAVRVLETACVRAGRGTPAVLAVVLAQDTARLRLATPDERPPTGWTAEPDGRTWYARLSWLQSAPVDEAQRAPYPRLVSLGTTDDGLVLVNLGQAGGIVCLEGDPRQTRTLALAWTAELTTSPWAWGVPVVTVGFVADPAGPAAAVHVADLAGPAAAVGVADLADAEPVMAGAGTGVLLLAGPPTGRDSERVLRLADDPAGSWSVVVVGPVDDARWRLTVDPTGRVDTDLLTGPAKRPEPSVDVPARSSAAAGGTGGAVGGTGRSGAAARPRGRLGSLVTTPAGILTLVALLCLLTVAIPATIPVLASRFGGRSSADHAASNTRPILSPSGATTSNQASASPSNTQSSASPSGLPSASSKPSASRSPSTTPTVAPGGTGLIRSLPTGLCVDSDTTPAMALDGTPSGGHAFSSACNGAASQQWSEGPLLSQDTPRADDAYRLVNRRTGLCLDGNEQSVYTLPCLDPDSYQVWQRVRPNATTVAYRNQATNRCLSMSKADPVLRTQPCPTGTTWPNDMLFRRLP